MSDFFLSGGVSMESDGRMTVVISRRPVVGVEGAALL